MDKSKHIILVRQLMALAESTRFEGERANALAKAKETMERYSLTTADITGEREAVLHHSTIDDATFFVYRGGMVSFETMLNHLGLNDINKLYAWWEEVEDEWE